jgi:hypothetical protein
MASKTFNLGEGNDGGSGASCSKICVIICCVLLVGVVIVVAIFAYNSNAIGGTSGTLSMNYQIDLTLDPFLNKKNQYIAKGFFFICKVVAFLCWMRMD